MDPEAFFVFAAFGLFVSIFAWLIIWSIRKDRAFRAALADLATANNWELRQEAQRRTSGAAFHFTPRDPAEGWSVSFHRARPKGRSGSRGDGSTLFTAPDPAFQGGLIVVTVEQHPSMGGALSQLAGVLDNAMGRAIMGTLLGDSVGRHVGQLQNFPAPEGSRLTVMATTDPALFFDLAPLSPLLHGWRPRKIGLKGAPVVTISDEGVVVRLGYMPDDAADIEKFIALGRAASAALRRG
jgi:heme exporter protein CcmD